MAEKIISPGVFQNESDQSLVQRGIQGTATAIVGPTVKGAPFVPTYVTSYSEFTNKYGETFKSGSYYYEYLTSLAAKDFFQNGGQTLLVTRVINGSGSVNTYAAADVTNGSANVGDKFATGSGALAAAFTDNTEARIVYGSTTFRFIASGDPIPSNDVDGNLYFFSTGSTATATVTNLVASVNSALSSSAASSSIDIVKAVASTSTFILSGSIAGTSANSITFATGSGNSEQSANQAAAQAASGGRCAVPAKCVLPGGDGQHHAAVLCAQPSWHTGVECGCCQNAGSH